MATPAYEPFIDDPKHVASLEGQRFVVLRAPGQLTASYCEVRDRLRERLQGLPVSYPARPHVTLCGFAAGTPLAEIQALVSSWAVHVPPLAIELAGLSVFPAPFKVVFLEVRKTPPLFAAMASLRAAAEQAGMVLSTATPVERWRFHMSLVYGPRLSDTQWRELEAFVQTLHAPPALEEVRAAEVVAFDCDGECWGGTFAFGPPPPPIESAVPGRLQA